MVREWHGRDTMLLHFAVDLVPELHTIYIFRVGLLHVPVMAEAPVEIRQDTKCDRQAHAEDVDEDEHFLLHKAAHSNEEIVFEHTKDWQCGRIYFNSSFVRGE